MILFRSISWSFLCIFYHGLRPYAEDRTLRHQLFDDGLIHVTPPQERMHVYQHDDVIYDLVARLSHVLLAWLILCTAGHR